MENILNMQKQRKKTNFWVNFNQSKQSNFWYNILYVILILIGIFLPFLLLKNQFYMISLISYYVFMIIQIYSMGKGLYKRPEANRFFSSIKAIDIYTHLIALFSIYFIILDLTSNDLLYNCLIAFLLGIFFEFIEFTFEFTQIAFKKKDKYSKYISESGKNILQDIFSNSMGIVIAYLVTIYFF